tara:strand:- start:392 stop:685 length:294 start_codon:yes stop_codon:yes gene_type:complete
MNTLDIVLLNGIFYLGGVLSGLGICFKYKKHLLLRTSSKEQLSEIVNSITNEIASHTNPGPPVFTGTPVMESELASVPPLLASAPPKELTREIVIRT